MKTPKKIIFVIATIVTLLCSCTKDNGAEIVGKWSAESITSFYYENGALQYSETEYVSAISMQLYFVFNADGTFSEVLVRDGDSETVTGSYLIVDSKLTLSPKSSGSVVSGLVFDINSLSYNTLVLSYEERDGQYKEVTETTFKRSK